MTLQEQIEFAGELEKKFLDLDRAFIKFNEYEGEFGQDADRMGHIIASLWRLQELEH